MWWVPQGGSGGWGLFHKYLVTEVRQVDRVGNSPDMVTSYDYSGSPAWAHADDDITPAGQQTWNDWRGYEHVEVTTGSGSGLTQTGYKVFRGMHGDKRVGAPPLVASLAPFTGPSYTDHPWLRGRILDQRVRNNIGSERSGQLTVYASEVTTSNATDEARYVWVNREQHRLRKNDNSQYQTETAYALNTDLQVSVIRDYGDNGPSGDDHCTRIYYAADTASHVLSYPSREHHFEGNCSTGSPPLEAATDYYYDGQAYGQAPTRGHVTHQRVSRDGSSGISTFMSYEPNHGRLASITDGNSQTSTTGYAPSLGFPATVTETNPLGHDTTTWMDWGRSIPLQVRDANLHTTGLGYDGLGRLIKVRKPTEAGEPNLSMEFAYRMTAFPGEPIRVQTRTLQSKTPLVYLDSWSYHDGHGRVRQTQTKSPTSGKSIVTVTGYDNRGNSVYADAPYAVSGNPGGTYFLATPLPPLRTTTTYDALGRPLDTATKVYGATQFTATSRYDGPVTTVTSPQGAKTRTTVDAFGDNTEVAEWNDGVWDAAGYGYDRMGNLTSITDPAGNQITYTYNRLGWRTGMNDPDAGTWTYDHDDNGNQTDVVDNVAATPTLVTVYDQVNRPTSRRTGSTTGPVLAEWVYDAAGEKGLLDKSIRHDPDFGAIVTDISGYDARNRPTGTTLAVPASPAAGDLAGSYPFTYEYDKADHRTKITYPQVANLGPDALTTTYTNIGAAATLTGGSTYVSNTTWDDRHRVQSRTLGGSGGANRVTRTYDYDSLQRLTGWNATKPHTSTTLQDDQITLDDDGNVTQRHDTLANQRECFDYDDRSRLIDAFTTTGANCSGTPATGPNPYDHDYEYSSDGRLLERTESGVTEYYTYPAQGAGSTQPHAVQAVDTNPAGPVEYTYDGNGNQTSRPGTTSTQTLTWNAEHQLETVTEGSDTTSFVYDPDGQRLLRVDGNEATLYFENHELTDTNTTSPGGLKAKRYYTLDGINVAVRDGATLNVHWLLGDHLGSTSLTVNASTGATATQRFLPYGKQRGSTGTIPTERGWIGQTHDTSTGLQYLNARYYDPDTGRFSSVDPVVDVDQPASSDRYGYGHSSPATKSDPGGLWVPLGNANKPEAGGTWDARRNEAREVGTGTVTKIRRPGETYVDARGLWTIRNSAGNDMDLFGHEISGYDLALRILRAGGIVEVAPGVVENHGAYDTCPATGIDSCRAVRTLLTWGDIAAAALRLLHEDAALAEWNTATVLKGVSTVSGLLAIIAAGLQPEVAPPLAGLSAVTAVGGEAADASPCRGERVVAQATQIVLTAGVSGAFAEGGAHGLSKLVDSTSFAFGAGGAVSC